MEVNVITNRQSVWGVVKKDNSSNFSVDTGIGNDSKIGVILYFYDLKIKKNK